MIFVFCAGWLLACATRGQSPVTVTIGPGPIGTEMPPNFIGMSFGSKTLPPDRTGGHFFSPTNKALITLLQNIGIKHLRVGGTSVESPPSTPIPDEADIDSFFALVKAARVQKVIYSFRLLEAGTNLNYAATNAALAKYIWQKYRPYLDCFAIGNEPDRRNIYEQDQTITNFDSYLSKWRRFAKAITNAVPEATFAGPDGGSANVFWTTNFAHAEKGSGIVRLIAEHFYPGGGGRNLPPARSVADMLSPGWLARNQALYDKMAVPVLADGFPYRFTEANDHFQGGTPDASNTFAGALWALDFLHWWAAHRARGVNFHNTQWVVNDVITPDANGRLGANPKAYGIKAFELGSHGRTETVAISNPDGLNLTAYGVRGAGDHFITVINKEHGSGARAADVTLAAPDLVISAAAVFLAPPEGNPMAKTGVTLGGAAINGTEPWLGKWEPLELSQPRQCRLKVPAVSAAVVKITLQPGSGRN